MKSIARKGIVAIFLVGSSACSLAGNVNWLGSTGSNWGDAAQWSPAQVPDDSATITIKPYRPDLMGNSYTLNYLYMNGETPDRIDGNGPYTVGGLLTLNGDASGVGFRMYTGGRKHYLYPNINLGMASRSVTNIWQIKPSEGGGGGELWMYGSLGGTGSLQLFSDPAIGFQSTFYYGSTTSAPFDGDTHVLLSRMYYYPSNITANATFRFGTRSGGGEATITLDRSLFEFAPVSHTAVAPTVILTNDFTIANTGISTVYRKRGRSTASMAYPNVIYGGRLVLAGPLLLGGESGSSPVANPDSGLFTPWTGGLLIDQGVAGWSLLRQNRSGTTPLFASGISDTPGPYRNPFIPGMDNNGALTFTASATYSRGTVVDWCGNTFDSGTWITLQAGNSQNAAVAGTAAGAFGTGDVVVAPGGRLYLNGTGILSSSQTVTVQGNPLAIGSVTFKDDGATALPQIAANSTGVISINGSSAAKLNALMAAGPGNNMFLGAGMAAAGTFTGTTLAPGGDGVYRIGGGNRAQTLTLDATGTTTGVLSGPHSVQVNAPVYNGSGAVLLSDTNSFTGALTVYGSLLDYRSSYLRGNASTAGGSPFGATNGTVRLSGAGLIVYGNGTVAKGATAFTSDSSIELTDGSTSQAFILESLTREDRAILRARDRNHSLGGSFRIVVRNPGADLTPDAAGMIAPCYVHDYNGTLDFATHSTAGGFAKVTYSANPLNTATGTDIVNQTVALALSATAQCHALRLGAALTASGADRTVTLNSGGLLMVGAGNYNIGAASSPTVNLDFGGSEGVVYSQNADRYLYGKLSNTGGNGLTLGGDLIRLVNPNNDFTGTVTINSGQIMAQFDKDDGTAHGSLGPTSNNLLLNGGYLGHTAVTGWRTLDANRTLTLGPLGGGFRVDASGGTTYLKCKITGSGALYLPGWVTYAVDNANNDWSGGTLINSYNNGTAPGCSATGKMGQGPVVLMSIIYSFPCTFTFNGNDNLHYTAGPEKYLPVTVVGFARAFFKSPAPVIGTLTGTGEVVLGSSGVNDTALTVGLDNGDGTFYGCISQAKATVGQGVGSLTKAGNGTFTLYGPHTFTGVTTVNGGMLRLMGSLTGNAVVGANGTISGIGRVGGALTVNGALAAELADDFAALRVGGAVTLASGAELDVTMADGFAPGEAAFTVLQAGGAISGLGNLTVSSGYAARIDGQSLVIFRRSAGTAIIIR